MSWAKHLKSSFFKKRREGMKLAGAFMTLID